MKKLLSLFMLLLVVSISAFAQVVNPSDTITYVEGTSSILSENLPSDIVPSLFTTLGIAALCSVIVTQLMKCFESVKRKKILKYALSIFCGIAFSFLGWWLNITTDLGGLDWYWILIHGVIAGLAGSGGYGIVKCFWNYLPHNEG